MPRPARKPAPAGAARRPQTPTRRMPAVNINLPHRELPVNIKEGNINTNVKVKLGKAKTRIKWIK